MIIKNLLEQLKKVGRDYNVVVLKDKCTYPVSGFEDSTSIGIWEIRYLEDSCGEIPGIKVNDLIELISEDLDNNAVTATMGNCYPSYKITNVYSDSVGSCIIEVTDFKTNNWWED